MLALAFLLIGGGALVTYTGITGQPFTPALRSVLTGNKPPAPATGPGSAGQPGASPTGGASDGTGSAGHDINVGTPVPAARPPSPARTLPVSPPLPRGIS